MLLTAFASHWLKHQAYQATAVLGASGSFSIVCHCWSGSSDDGSLLPGGPVGIAWATAVIMVMIEIARAGFIVLDSMKMSADRYLLGTFLASWVVMRINFS